MLSHDASWLPAAQVPDAARGVIAPGGQEVPVRRHVHPNHVVLMTLQRLHHLGLPRIPQLALPVKGDG